MLCKFCIKHSWFLIKLLTFENNYIYIKPLTVILIYFLWNGIHEMNAVYNYNDK